MSAEDEEVIRAATSFGPGTSLDEIAASWWHPDIEYREDPRWPDASVYRGRAATLEVFKGYQELLGIVEVVVEQIVRAAERYAVIVLMRGEAAQSGAPHDHRWGYVVGLRDGRIASMDAFYDADAALEAARGEG